MGGNGVNGGNIYITVPNGQSQKIIFYHSTSIPGKGGKGGDSGMDQLNMKIGLSGRNGETGKENGSPACICIIESN